MHHKLERIAGVTNKASAMMQRDLHIEDRVSSLATLVRPAHPFPPPAPYMRHPGA